MAVLGMVRARSKGENFCEEAFDGEIVGHRGCFDFAEKFHAEPKQRSAAEIFAGSVHGGGAISKALLPGVSKLDFKETQAAGADLILVWNACRPKHDGERTELRLPAAVPFAVVAFEKQGKKGKFMRVHRELAWREMAQIGEDSSTSLALAVDGAEKTAGAHALVLAGRVGRRNGTSCGHRS